MWLKPNKSAAMQTRQAVSPPHIGFCPASIAKVAKSVILLLATILLTLLTNVDVWKVSFLSCRASQEA
jgi:hypothetical protein